MNDQEGESRKEREEGSRKELVYVRPISGDPYPESDEISLVDLWLVLARRKWIIMGITVLCLALGAGYVLMKPVVYDYRTVIELAEVHGGPESEGLERISSREGSIDLLQSVIIPAQRESIFGEEGNGPSVEVEKSDSDNSLLIKSTARPEKADQVKELHQDIVKALDKEQAPDLKKRIDVTINPFKARAEMLQEQINTLQEELQRLSGRSRDVNSTRKLVYVLRMANIRAELAEARVKLTEPESAVETIREKSRSTRTSFLAAASEDPVGAGKHLVISLSVVLGLMLGVFAAFFMEFLTHAKAAAQERKD